MLTGLMFNRSAVCRASSLVFKLLFGVGEASAFNRLMTLLKIKYFVKIAMEFYLTR